MPGCLNFLGRLGTLKTFSLPLPKTDSAGLGESPGLCSCDLRTSAVSLPLSLCTCIWSGLPHGASRYLGVGRPATGKPGGGHCQPSQMATAAMVDGNSSQRVRIDPTPPQHDPGTVTSKCLSLSLGLAFVK